LNTPKSWWHDCDHKFESLNSKYKTFSEKSVDCDFCDHDLSAFTVHHYDFFKIQKVPNGLFLSNSTQDIAIHSVELQKLRGPPSKLI
jgi:hypothetical protein